MTIRGGPLLGFEALAMQGLPLDELILTRESQKQLQDLAGNAMTSTVVGPAILCALMVGYRALTKGSGKATSAKKVLIIGLDDSALKKLVLDLTACKPTPVSVLCLEAQRSVRLCICEGANSIDTKRLLVCELCEHIACEKCAGIPKHSYRVLDQAQMPARLKTHKFEEAIKDALPMRLQLVGLDFKVWNKTQNTAVETIDPEVWKYFNAVIKDISTQELRFHSAKRTHCWTINFDAPRARLELIFFDLKAQWHLYAKPDSKLPVNSKVRQLMKYPIARMVPEENSLLKGSWEVRIPLTTSVRIIIEGRGGLTRSWEARLGLQAPEFADKKVWTVLQVAIHTDLSARLHLDIAGEYELLQQCGGASGSLHRRVSDRSEDKPPLYLFLDVEPIGNPKDDRFVFSTGIQRINCREAANVIASVESSWRPSSVEGPKAVDCDVDGQWVHIDAILQAFQHTEPAIYRVLNEDISFRVPGGTPIRDHGEEDDEDFVNTGCRGATAILSCEVPLMEIENVGWHSGAWVVIDENSERQFYASFSWLTEKARGLHGFLPEWRPLGPPIFHVKCQQCAPDSPCLKWSLTEAGKTKRIAAHEDPRQAGRYERAMKLRAAPFVTYTRIDENRTGRLMIGLNVPTLAHRALAKLPGLTSYNGVTMSWRLVTQYLWLAKPNLPRLKILSNKEGANISYVFPAQEGLDGDQKELKLRKEQQRSLNWMIAQEAEDPKPFMEQEIEEANLQHLLWRAEVKVTRSRKVKGGVLADEVGYGKTATTLALIDAQASKTEIAAKPCTTQCMPLKATLIIVPRHLGRQWREEVKKFLGTKYTVILIEEPRNLTSETVDSFEQADIIIVAASVFTTDSYLQKLSLFAALPEAPATAGRALNAWLARATERISGNVEELKRTIPTRDFASVLNARLAAAEADDELLRFVPSKRLRGKAYAAAAQEEEGGGEKETSKKRANKVGAKEAKHRTSVRQADVFGIGKSKTTSQISNPIFQMFWFNRLVIDEYTFIDTKAYTFMTSLQAGSRWILSGTPALDDFADVKRMAGLLGVNLGIDDDTVGVMKSENIRAIRKDRTGKCPFST